MATPTTLPATFTSGQVLTAAQMNNLRGAFRVLQIVSTTKTDTFTMNSSTFADVTGLTATITPSATSSLILVVCNLTIGMNNVTAINARMRRGSTDIGIGAAASNRTRVSQQVYFGGNTTLGPLAFSVLDNPATTSATTYGVQIAANTTGNNVHLNRSDTDTDAATFARGASTITVMEISA